VFPLTTPKKLFLESEREKEKVLSYLQHPLLPSIFGNFLLVAFVYIFYIHFYSGYGDDDVSEGEMNILFEIYRE
jgi:hypothetical protein